MSTLKVEVVEIEKVEEHPNADRLDLVHIKGWQCVAGRNAYMKGQLAVYIPIDSILPQELEAKLFGPDSKIKLNKSRVKTIKIRGAISQGMLVDLDTAGYPKAKLGDDLTEKLGITKYEPPTTHSGFSGGKAAPKRHYNPNFRKYTSIENFKNYSKLFAEGEDVVITEKIHGTNFRCGYVKSEANTLWKKIKKLFGKFPEYEFVYGSHNIQLQDKLLYDGYYDTNVYAECVRKYDLKNKLKHGEVIYGEIYGPNIQKGYHYGCADGERRFVAFDLQVQGEYVSHSTFYAVMKDKDLPIVPVLYKGPFSLEKAKELAKGDSILCPEQKVREGIVIKPRIEEHTYMGRKVLKLINDTYLLCEQTEWH